MKERSTEKANYRLVSPFSPQGDQPAAIERLSKGVEEGEKMQTLLGVTGSGKTFTMANIIAKTGRPAIILEPNKTLASQVCQEMRELFPDSAVEFFVSYYDYYQPEAYIPGKDMYIEKDALVNDEIDRLRHSATTSLFERRDVIIVASVSCIYSLGDPEEYAGLELLLFPDMEMPQDIFIRKLVANSYKRNDFALARDCFRVNGDTVDIVTANRDKTALRVSFFDDVIESISEIDLVTGKKVRNLTKAYIFPANHYAVSDEKKEAAFDAIRQEMVKRKEEFEAEGKLVEAQRIQERVLYDLEMLREVGFCSGIENYSRILSGREPGCTPFTLLDYFPRDYLMFIDESHVTIPQIRGMSGGDTARKKNLVDYGFRLPSAYDNRPLHFDEFEKVLNQVIFVSATPGDYEMEHATTTVEQIIRPTGLPDPVVEVRPMTGCVDDLYGEIRQRMDKGERVLVTTLTTKMAEDLTEYFDKHDVKVRYIHHHVETLERMEILRDLRLGLFDVLVGINLLREGLDIPEVSLVAILDADKEGFLRTERSLIQTIGRAARNAEGRVILYGDTVTKSMQNAMVETERRRNIQLGYNKANGITPKTVIKPVRDVISLGDGKKTGKAVKSKASLEEQIKELTAQMKEAASRLEFEQAAFIRDQIKLLEKEKK